MFAASKKVLGQDSTDYTGQVKGSQHVTVKLDIDVRREVMRGGSEYHDDYCTLLSLAALAALSLVNSDGEFCAHTPQIPIYLCFPKPCESGSDPLRSKKTYRAQSRH